MSLDVSYITPTSMLVVSTLLPALAGIAVVGRFYVRRRQKAELLWDDWLLIPALLLTIGMAIAQIYSVAEQALGYPKGLPPGAPPEEQFIWLQPRDVVFQKVEYAVQLMQPLALGCIKTSFIMFYRRIFCTGQRTWFSFYTIAMLVLIVLWSIAFCLVFIFRCGNNFSASWGTVEDLIVYCPTAFASQEAFAISDFIMDVMVILAPVPLIFKLHMNWTRKLSISAIFMLGLIAIAASTVRMAVVVISTNTGFSAKVDGDLYVGSILLWSMVENNAALIAACLPTMRILFTKNSLESVVRSVRSMVSLKSLRSVRGDSTSNTSANHTFLNDNKESTTNNEYHLTRLQGESSVKSHVDHTKSNPGLAEEGGIAVRKDLLQEESYK